MRIERDSCQWYLRESWRESDSGTRVGFGALVSANGSKKNYFLRKTKCHLAHTLWCVYDCLCHIWGPGCEWIYENNFLSTDYIYILRGDGINKMKIEEDQTKAHCSIVSLDIPSEPRPSEYDSTKFDKFLKMTSDVSDTILFIKVYRHLHYVWYSLSSFVDGWYSLSSLVDGWYSGC